MFINGNIIAKIILFLLKYPMEISLRLPEKNMLLTIDIGNTSTTIGIFDGKELLDTWSISSEHHRSEDEIGIIMMTLLQLHSYLDKVKSAIICSVVVPLTERYKNALQKYMKITPFVVSNKNISLLKFNVDFPEEVGADRIVNAYAAYSIYKTNCIVVDFGTATTFDIVTQDGTFQGGVIAAGMKIQAESLKKYTSKLPLIKIETPPQNAIGKNSIDAMLSGTVRGHAYMIDGMLEACEKELGIPVKIIATGGYSTIIAGFMNRKFDEINPNITIEGLRLINEHQLSKHTK